MFFKSFHPLGELSEVFKLGDDIFEILKIELLVNIILLITVYTAQVASSTDVPDHDWLLVLRELEKMRR